MKPIPLIFLALFLMSSALTLTACGSNTNTLRPETIAKQVGTYYGDPHAQISGSVTSTVSDSSQEPMYIMAITGIFHKNGMTAYTIGFSALADRMYVWSVSALDKQGNEVWVDHVLKL